MSYLHQPCYSANEQAARVVGFMQIAVCIEIGEGANIWFDASLFEVQQVGANCINLQLYKTAMSANNATQEYSSFCILPD
jgi:hypothetical protein